MRGSASLRVLMMSRLAELCRSVFPELCGWGEAEGLAVLVVNVLSLY